MKGSRSDWIQAIHENLSAQEREMIASIIETADAQGDYYFDGEGSAWEDDVQMTLRFLANEFRD